MQAPSFLRSKDSFTLVELLVVIGILAILTAAVVIVLNPAELLKQSRDSKRTTDLAAVNNALKILLTQSPDVSLGMASTVYVSLADSSSTCGSYALPPIPAGWQYRCAPAASLTKADGSGWIPVNFSNGASQLPALPSDPQNDAATRLYYAYAAASGRWEIASSFESAKYASKEAGDGGTDPAGYEVGPATGLMPFANGLIGYWNFDEGAGTTAADGSGFGKIGTLTNGPVWQSGSACKIGACLSFDGVQDEVAVQDSPLWNVGTGSFSFSAWVNLNNTGDHAFIDFYPLGNGHSIFLHSGGTGFFFMIRPSAGSDTMVVAQNAGGTTQGAWHHIALTRSGTAWAIYRDGVQIASAASGLAVEDGSYLSIGHYQDSDAAEISLNGYLDDVRLYNRALSAAEIQAIYNANK